MPPAGEPYRVADTRNAEPFRDRHRVIFRRPDAVRWHFTLKTEPLGAGSTIPSPIEARMIGEDLNARADNEHHDKQVEKMQQPQPQREARVNRPRGRSGTGVAHDEFLYAGRRAQSLGDSDSEDQYT